MVARTYARTRPRSRPLQLSRTTAATKNRVEEWGSMLHRTPAPRILAGWLESQSRAAAMGKDRKKVGSAYVHIHTMFYTYACIHVCAYARVRESVCVCVRIL